MTKSIEELKAFFAMDRFATNNGMYIESVREGDAVCAMEIKPELHHNAVGGVQGGVLFTLADFAFAVATNCGDSRVVSLKSDISFIRGSRGKKLTAHATQRAASRKVCFYDIDITDDLGELIAVVSITGYIKQ